jgi:hypothetical protein
MKHKLLLVRSVTSEAAAELIKLLDNDWVIISAQPVTTGSFLGPDSGVQYVLRSEATPATTFEIRR